MVDLYSSGVYMYSKFASRAVVFASDLASGDIRMSDHVAVGH